MPMTRMLKQQVIQIAEESFQGKMKNKHESLKQKCGGSVHDLGGRDVCHRMNGREDQEMSSERPPRPCSRSTGGSWRIVTINPSVMVRCE